MRSERSEDEAALMRVSVAIQCDRPAPTLLGGGGGGLLADPRSLPPAEFAERETDAPE